MNINSYICRYKHENNNWKEGLLSKKISVKESGNFAIFNYDTECDFNDPIVQEDRGIIIDINSLDVVCWPFRKFGNYGESYADDIDWNTARVQEKIDGSIVKLWYNHSIGEWQWSTNGMIDANDAHIMNSAASFMSLIRRATNHSKISYDLLDKDKTYIFELVAPEQRIVIKYEYPFLYHIGTRSNVTGQEFNEDIGIKKPDEYPLHTLRDCINTAEKLNKGSESVEREGYVVVDDNWHRIKVKSPEYVYVHRVASSHIFTKKQILPILMSNGTEIEEIIKNAPDSEIYIRYYQWRYAELKKRIAIAITKARAMYEELNADRKALAIYIKDEPLKAFCFKALGNNKMAYEIIAELNENIIMNLIEDYSENIIP